MQDRPSLTFRETQIAWLVSTGLPDKLVARRLNISVNTVKAALKQVYRKLCVESRLQLALVWNDYRARA